MADEMEMTVEVEGFQTVDTDRARASVEIEKMKIDQEASRQKVQDLSIHVSCKVLTSLGLDQYAGLFESKGIGIDELRGLDSGELKELGIKDSLHRSKILAAAQKPVVADPPKLNAKEPVQVRVKMGFGRLADINTVEGTCRVKLFVDFYWNDPRLVGVDPHMLPEFIWVPNAYFYNSIDRTGEDGGKLNEHPPSLMDYKTGLILKPLEIEVIIWMQMNLRKFPFDENAIKLHLLQSEDSTGRDWVFAPALDPPSSIKFFYDTLETPEFDLTGFSLDFFEGVGGNGVIYSNCMLYVNIRRRPLFFMWKTVVPLFLTTAYAFTCFFFEPLDLEARSTTAQTTLLTTVALLFVLAQELPKTNYLTKIDTCCSVLESNAQCGCFPAATHLLIMRT